jgi:hypothetical protein
MLALADKNGEIQSSIPGLADMARVPREDCEIALRKFLDPDPDSRTKDSDGRRIAEIDGGWELLNHQKYRKMSNLEDNKRLNSERQRRFRDRQNGVTQIVTLRNASVTHSNASVTHSNASVTHSNASVTHSNATVTHSNATVTHLPYIAEAEAEAEAVKPDTKSNQDINNTACAETEKPVSPPASPSLIVFDCDGNQKKWNLTQDHVTEWQSAYPSLDIISECNKARAWVNADTSRRKTARGMKRFLVGWFGRSQNRGHAQTPSRLIAQDDPNYSEASILAEIEAKERMEKDIDNTELPA